MAYCTNCGEALEPGDERCPSCGEPVKSKSARVVDREGLELADVTLPRPVYYAAAAGLVIGCFVYILAGTAVQLFVGVGIVALGAGILLFDYHAIRPHRDGWFTAVIGGVWLYLIVLVLSVMSTLPTAFDVGTWGLPSFTVLYRQHVGVALVVSGVILAAAVLQLRQEQAGEGERDPSL